jgi:hypothetical protein
VISRNANYETVDIQITIDGVTREGRFRVLNGSVIVYFRSEIKFASYGMDRPETVARWLLTDLVRKMDAMENKNKG